MDNTINEGFESLRSAWLSEITDERILLEYKKAFMAGALHIVTSINNKDSDDIPEILENMQDELKQFYNEECAKEGIYFPEGTA